MRKFRFVGNNSEAFGYGKKRPSRGTVYGENEVFLSRTVLEWAEDYALGIDNEWQEVFEEPTLQDRIQELKDFAKGQGLKVDVVVDDIDIREGVEYAESLYNLDCGDGKFTKRNIYPINNIGKKTLTFKFDDNCNPINASSKSFFKPSTESAYVEQLKKEAFERFGKIKHGDKIVWEFGNIDTFYDNNFGFSYFKSHDSFCYNGTEIYKSGKWAKKLPKRVEVELDSHSACANHDFHTHEFSFTISRTASQFEPIKAGQFLAKQLEKYLNGEVE